MLLHISVQHFCDLALDAQILAFDREKLFNLLNNNKNNLAQRVRALRLMSLYAPSCEGFKSWKSRQKVVDMAKRSLVMS